MSTTIPSDLPDITFRHPSGDRTITMGVRDLSWQLTNLAVADLLLLESLSEAQRSVLMDCIANHAREGSINITRAFDLMDVLAHVPSREGVPAPMV